MKIPLRGVSDLLGLNRVVRRRSLEPSLKFVPGQTPSYEDEPALALLIRFPRALPIAFNQHVHTLDNEAFVIAVHCDDAFHPENVLAETSRDSLNPGDELSQD